MTQFLGITVTFPVYWVQQQRQSGTGKMAAAVLSTLKNRIYFDLDSEMILFHLLCFVLLVHTCRGNCKCKQDGRSISCSGRGVDLFSARLTRCWTTATEIRWPTGFCPNNTKTLLPQVKTQICRYCGQIFHYSFLYSTVLQ